MNWRDCQRLLSNLVDEENVWRTREVSYPGEKDLFSVVGWFPFPIPRFISLLAEAVAVTAGPMFLDVGAGPGTKVELARSLFRLRAHGIELSPEMVQAAGNRDVQRADARTFTGYRAPDIVYMNRPVLPPEPLEMLVMQRMHPGAVLILANGITRPSDHGWDVVSEELRPGPVTGAWKKP